MCVCCFFGHRDAPEELLPSLVSLLEELTEQQGITVFWVGGHGQFDRLAAEAVCRLRERFPRIRLELVAAYSYAAEKPPRMADRAFLPEGLAQAPPKAAIVRRNRWMAQHADVVGRISGGIPAGHTGSFAKPDAGERGLFHCNQQ